MMESFNFDLIAMICGAIKPQLIPHRKLSVEFLISKLNAAKIFHCSILIESPKYSIVRCSLSHLFKKDLRF